MAKQFNIRNEIAYDLALRWSERLNMPMHKVVEQALRAFDAKQPKPVSAIERLKSVLEHDQELLRRSQSAFEIEDLYDPETGLPT